MRRRTFLSLAASAATGLRPLVAGAGENTLRAVHQGWRDLRASDLTLVELEPKLTRSRSAWRAALPADAYSVLFEEATEAPFTSPLDGEKRAGLFLCRACDLALFSSAMKYDSGTGWPSFFTCIPQRLATKDDYTLLWPRTEYHCVKCGGHHGHRFDDGPPPSGQRWCNNGVALRFVPATGD